MIPNTRLSRGLAYSANNRRRSASVRRATRQPLTLPGEAPTNRTIARVAVCILLTIAALSGALRRIAEAVTARNKRAEIVNFPIQRKPLGYYHQTDPRGCALYILRPGDVPEGEDVSAYYSRGLAVCI